MSKAEASEPPHPEDLSVKDSKSTGHSHPSQNSSLDMALAQPRKKTAFSIRDLLGLQQQQQQQQHHHQNQQQQQQHHQQQQAKQDRDVASLSSRLAEGRSSELAAKSRLLNPLAGDSFFGAPGVRVPGFRYRTDLGGYPPHWRTPLIDSLSTSGQTILNFNIFSAASAHCDVFKAGRSCMRLCVVCLLALYRFV